MISFLKKIYYVINYEYKWHYLNATYSIFFSYVRLSILKIFNKEIIAICFIEHIGDIIAAEPIYAQVKRDNPKSKVFFFTNKKHKELVRFNPSINKVISIYCLGSWIRLKKFIKFSQTYELHFNGRMCTKCYKTLNKIHVDNTVNANNYFNYGGILKAICIENKFVVSNENPKIYIPDFIANKLENKIKQTDYITINCKSNDKIKDWEDKKWKELILSLINRLNLKIIEIGLISSLDFENSNYINMCGRLSLLESALLIKRSRLFIGIDSGPSHIANAVETPGIILIGEYNKMKYYNPFSGNYSKNIKSEIIHSDGYVQEIQTETVYNTALKLLS